MSPAARFAVAGALVGLLAGCASDGPVVEAAIPTDTAATDAASAAAFATFTATVRQVVDEADGAPAPVASVTDALVRAGFDPQSIEYTADATAVGLVPSSIVVSVQQDEDCLVAQYGAEVTFRSVRLPLLPGGGCLVGASVADG
ncbi:MAG: hypothetical protein QM635_09860 [Microbacteriaceae bacterium]